MKQVGHYEEPLCHGGTLRVWKGRWQVQYYFAGPDRRYSGKVVTFEATQLPALIEAYDAAFSRFEELRSTLPAGATLEAIAGMGLKIRVGGFANGVCMAEYHNPISDRATLAARLTRYREAMARAITIGKYLADL